MLKPYLTLSRRFSLAEMFILAIIVGVVSRSALADDPATRAGQDKKEQSSPTPLPRVLIIGDSISIGYTKAVRDLLKGKADVYRVSGNAGHTGMGLAKLDDWIKPREGRKWDVIHFNWGLWDLCYRNPKSKNQGRRDKVSGKLTHTPQQYEKNLRLIVTKLKTTDAKLIWASTTPVPDGESGRIKGDDLVYNRVAAGIMKQNGIRINDLHAGILPEQGKLAVRPGDVHFRPAGYRLLAELVAKAIESELDRDAVSTSRADRHE